MPTGSEDDPNGKPVPLQQRLPPLHHRTRRAVARTLGRRRRRRRPRSMRRRRASTPASTPRTPMPPRACTSTRSRPTSCFRSRRAPSPPRCGRRRSRARAHHRRPQLGPPRHRAHRHVLSDEAARRGGEERPALPHEHPDGLPRLRQLCGARLHDVARGLGCEARRAREGRVQDARLLQRDRAVVPGRRPRHMHVRRIAAAAARLPRRRRGGVRPASRGCAASARCPRASPPLRGPSSAVYARASPCRRMRARAC